MYYVWTCTKKFCMLYLIRYDSLSSIFQFIFTFQTEMSVALIKVSGKAASPHRSCFPKPPVSIQLRSELRVIYLNSQWFKISFGAARAQNVSTIVIFHRGFLKDLTWNRWVAKLRPIVFTCAATFIKQCERLYLDRPWGTALVCA